MSDSLIPSKDLTDPATLVAECDMCLSGLRLEIQAKNGHSAMGGVPDPLFFFTRTAALLAALRDRVAAELERPKAEPEPSGEPKAPEPRKIKPPKEQP